MGRKYPASVSAMFESLWRHRSLVLQLSRREVLSRYQGSVLGMAWSFFNPLLMLVVYTFVFSVAFKARWGGDGSEGKANFAIILFVGLIVHGLLSECLNRAPTLIVSNVAYVKKVVFPLEILPFVAIVSASFNAAVSLVVLLAVQLVLSGGIPWTAVFIPLVLGPLMIATVGLTMLVSAIGVYFRDIGQTIGVITMVLLFLAPVFYPITALPEHYRILLHLNPLTFIIEEARGVLIWGQLPSWLGLAIYSAMSLLIAWVGFWWFQRTRTGFADVV